MLVRIRLEASGATESEVKQELVDAFERARDEGAWVATEENVQTTKTGFWGFMTCYREDDNAK